ncbi:25180_t:CDS:2 [Gigaspora rosea]|nr:25180_t:CDS:2 [Gigaspora rosea]
MVVILFGMVLCFLFYDTATTKKNDANCKELEEYIVQPLFDREALQGYHKGGLIDKPKRSPDYYHTCYCLISLSTSQHHELNAGDRYLPWSEDETKNLVLSDPSNVVNATHTKAKTMIE